MSKIYNQLRLRVAVLFIALSSVAFTGCDEIESMLNVFNLNYKLGDSSSSIDMVDDVKLAGLSYTTLEGVASGESGALQDLGIFAASLAVDYLLNGDVDLPLQAVFNVAVQNDTDSKAVMNRIDIALELDKNGDGNFEPSELKISVNSSGSLNSVSGWSSTTVSGSDTEYQWDFAQGDQFQVSAGEVKALPIAIELGNAGNPASLLTSDSDLMTLATSIATGDLSRIKLKVRPYLNIAGTQVPTVWIPLSTSDWYNSSNE